MTSRSRALPARRKIASNTSGSVSTDGPVSKVTPSTVATSALPPGPDAPSKTVTDQPSAASVSAAPSPPRPALITAARRVALTTPRGRRPDRAR
ncbi:MAG: hypothetical protein U0325_36170 [Polyangiales bacterium]